MNNKHPKLTCTLKSYVTTREGDFIPAGTPVQVVGWANEGRLIEVRCGAYMFADDFNINDIVDGRSHGCVGSGLFVAVPPSSLEFAAISDEWTLPRE